MSMSYFGTDGYLQMNANMATLVTSLCICAFVICCALRYFLRHCCRHRSKRRGLPNYTTQYYITNSGHQCSRFYFDERNQIRSMVITASIQPTSTEQYPQIVGFVLDPSVLESEHPAESPRPPRYEDALKQASAPPRYEEESNASSSPPRSIEFPPSGRTTARMESSVEEISSTDGEFDDLKSPRHQKMVACTSKAQF
ncbi:hypothetical protein GCK32_018575 [Trichostrongylus colubriformis]|uniref:Uncharacterized protein n=1 Tax=Trichostrongylus colubriformis TaxID=6319 RepID=A0AAN8F726_TRICO